MQWALVQQEIHAQLTSALLLPKESSARVLWIEARAHARRDALTQQQEPGIDHAHDTDSVRVT